MTKDKTQRWKVSDAPAENLLDEIGASELAYYSAGEERKVDEALRSWPLLGVVSRALRAGGSSPRPGRARRKDEQAREAEPPLRVIVPDAEPPLTDGIEEDDDPDSARKEAG